MWHAQTLTKALADVREILRGSVHKMLEAWCYEAMKKIEKKENDNAMDENSKLACTIHAHLLLLYRNVPRAQLNDNIISTVLSSFIFLTTRHTWNMVLLPIPETEMFELMQVCALGRFVVVI